MGGNMEILHAALAKEFSWLKVIAPLSDQGGDYHSTASTIANHEAHKRSGIRVSDARTRKLVRKSLKWICA